MPAEVCSASVRHVILVEFPPSGGLFQFALQLGEGLSRRGHRVELLTGPRPELSSAEQGCVVRSVLPTWHPTAGADAPEWWRRIRRGVRAAQYVMAWLVLLLRLRSARPDVVLWSSWRFAIDGWGVRVARRLLPGAILGLVAHEPRPLTEQPGDDGLYRSSAVLDQALAGAYRSLDVAFVLGESARQVLSSTWPVRAPVVIIPHGDEGIFLRNDHSAPDTNAADAGTDTGPDCSTPVDRSGPHVLFFGTITGYKGADELLACWQQVRAAVPTARLVLAGNVGADVDATALRRQVAGLDGVELRAGYVPVDQVPPLFADARVVALPYRRSSQSGVAHLAYTFGRPVVATAVGDIRSVVRDEETGLLVPPGDTAALAEALVRLLTDETLAARLGAAGREQLRTGASWDQVAGAVDGGLDAAGPRTGPFGNAANAGYREDRLQVLHVLDSFSFGGAENLVAELGRNQPPGWKLRVASLAPASQGRDAMLDRLTAAGLQPFHLGIGRLADPAGFVRLVRTLRRLRPDVIHAHLGYSATLLPVAARLAGIGCVSTLHHEPGPLTRIERFKERLSVRIPARLGILILLSSAAFDGFAERYGPAQPSWRLVPNGVDTAAFADAPPAADLVRTDDLPTWATVAALRAPKGHQDLLQAWRMLLDSGQQARLLIVGDGLERPTLQATIERLGLAGQVRLLGRRGDVPAVLAAVDGVVSASHTEALPTALIEAAAAGLPVVSTDAGGARDVVTAETGWLVPAHDPTRLATALQEAIGDPEEAVRRGKAARERAEEQFSWPVWTRRLDNLYRSMLRPRARHRLDHPQLEQK